MHGQIHIKLRH